MTIPALSKLAHWRYILVAWHRGRHTLHTQGQADPLADAMEKWLTLRVEVSALVTLLVNKKVFSNEEFLSQMVKSARYYDAQMQREFKGFATHLSTGLEIEDEAQAELTMKRLNFPP